MTTISVTYDLKIDGNPAICALVARQLVDYLKESAVDIQRTILDCAYPPNEIWDGEDGSTLEQQLWEAWNDDNWDDVDVALGRVAVRADPSLRDGDTVAAAALINDYIHRNIFDRPLTPFAKIDILNLSTGISVYQTLERLVGNLSLADITAGRSLLIHWLAANVQLERMEVQP